MIKMVDPDLLISECGRPGRDVWVNSPGSGSLAINGVSPPGKPCCVTYMFGKLMCYHEIHHILVWLSSQCDVSVAGMSERERERYDWHS